MFLLHDLRGYEAIVSTSQLPSTYGEDRTFVVRPLWLRIVLQRVPSCQSTIHSFHSELLSSLQRKMHTEKRHIGLSLDSRDL